MERRKSPQPPESRGTVSTPLTDKKTTNPGEGCERKERMRTGQAGEVIPRKACREMRKAIFRHIF